MQNNDFRAKQFMPFDSLKGFYDMLELEEQNKKMKISLSDDSYDYLNDNLKQIKKGDNILVKYYYEIDYIKTIDIVKNIDKVNKKIYLKNSIISFEDIIDIKII